MRIKHYGLIIGLFLVVFSFLFFGRAQNLYQLLLIGGLLISLSFYLTVIFSKGSLKSKIIWTIVIILSVILQRLSEPILIKSSYLIYLTTHKSELSEVNQMLSTKMGEISVLNDTVIDKSNKLTIVEKEKLRKLRQNLNVYMISKSENTIYYGFWGFLDVRLGITYLIDNRPNKILKPLKDNWYH